MFGLVRKRNPDIVWMKLETSKHFNVHRFWVKWLASNLPEELADCGMNSFPHTSNALDGTVAAKRHMDVNNKCISIVATFCNFEGGKLKHFLDDNNRQITVEQLDEKSCVELDVEHQPKVIS